MRVMKGANRSWIINSTSRSFSFKILKAILPSYAHNIPGKRPLQPHAINENCRPKETSESSGSGLEAPHSWALGLERLVPRPCLFPRETDTALSSAIKTVDRELGSKWDFEVAKSHPTAYAPNSSSQLCQKTAANSARSHQARPPHWC